MHLADAVVSQGAMRVRELDLGLLGYPVYMPAPLVVLTVGQVLHCDQVPQQGMTPRWPWLQRNFMPLQRVQTQQQCCQISGLELRHQLQREETRCWKGLGVGCNLGQYLEQQ